MNAIATFLIVFILIIGFSVGGVFLGIYYQEQKDVLPEDNCQNSTVSIPLIGELNSALFSPITAHGIATKIGMGTITLSNGGDEYTINIKSDAGINKLVLDKSKGSYIYQSAQFSDVKINDTLDIQTEILLDGSIRASQIIIYPVVK